MRLELHPPLFLSPRNRQRSRPGSSYIAHLHLKVWLDLTLDEWRERRRAHRHFLSLPASACEAWRAIDVGGHLLSLELPEGCRASPIPSLGKVEELAAAALADREIVVHHFPVLDATSEIDEPLEAFRARAGVELKPVLQRRIDSIREEKPPALPVALRAQQVKVESERDNLAGALALAFDDAETCRFSLADAVSRAEIGCLYFPEELELSETPGMNGLPERLRNR